MNITAIRRAGWVVAWDPSSERHVYLRDADLVFRGDRIIHIGEHYPATVDREIDGRARMVLPGLIDTHAHMFAEPLYKGFSDDLGNPQLGMSSLYDYTFNYGPSPEDYRVCTQAASCELLRSGVTTVVELGIPFDGWLDVLAGSGLRVVVGPLFSSAMWRSVEGRRVEYDWAADDGEAEFAEAMQSIEEAERHPSGRLSGMIVPMSLDTCSPALLQKSMAEARQRGCPFQTHAAQTLWEFGEITRRHGMTPVQWAHHLGLLGPRTLIGHGIFVDTHSWTFWGTRQDIALLGQTGTSIAHCPTIFARHGILLESFRDYRAAGVGVTIGTDSYPHNMLEEMRLAAQLGRVADRHVKGVDTEMVFEAATTAGARALGRTDIGRLSVGAKADLVIVDCEVPAMRPARDPLRSLIFCAADRAVRDVFVDGRQVVTDFEVTTLDERAVSAALNAALPRAEAQTRRIDPAGRAAEELAPLSLRTLARTPGGKIG